MMSRLAGQAEQRLRRAYRVVRRRLKRTWARLLVARFVVRNRVSRTSVVGTAPVVVSLTSYGARIHRVSTTIESIAAGAVRPARLILWLDEEPHVCDPPAALTRLRRRGLEIRLSENYGPHTKYYPYAVEEAPHRVPLVTADDDVLYPRRWLHGLVAAHDHHPDCVVCYRAAVVQLDHGAIAPYEAWPMCRGTDAGHTRFATGVSGVLYPPHAVEEFARAGEGFQQMAPTADDVWLHWLELRAGIPVRQVATRPVHFPLLPRTQQGSLMSTNVAGGVNDRWIDGLYTAEDVARLKDG